MTVRIPLAKPEITEADREAVMQVLRTPHLSMGPKLREFEQAMCEYVGSKYAVGVNSGTSALHLAVRALRLQRGAEVILPSFTFSALLNVILQEGLRPRLVDIDSETYNTTPEMIEAAITPGARLILAVHTFGFPVDVQAIKGIAERSSAPIHLIEDTCEALGSEVRGRKAGGVAEAGLFAFYPNKQITTGEGGMIVTSNAQVAASAQRLRNQGRDSQVGFNDHAEAGFSYRISDINCALGMSQLVRIEDVIARRQQLAGAYDRALANVPEIIRPPLSSTVGRISWFVYPVQLAPEFDATDRQFISESLQKRGIQTGRYFAPLHRQPVLSACAVENARAQGDLRNSEFVADRVIALPFFNKLTGAEIQEVVGALEDSIYELRRKT